MIRIVIIEDERLIAEELQQRLVLISSDVEVKAILRSVNEARFYFANHEMPDLVFSDIMLPDGLSFEVFSKMAVPAPVVFVTAFDRYMVNAFENNGIDYLLKPVDDQELRKVIGKFKMLGRHFSERQAFFESFGRHKKRLVVKKGMANISLRLSDIVLFYTEDKITYTIDRDGRKYICDRNLFELNEYLSQSGFFRANRQYLLNAEFIRGFKSFEKVKIMVDLAIPLNDHQVIVSQETAPSFRKWMNEM